MFAIALLLSLAFGSPADAAKASTGALKLVELFLGTPTADLPPEAVPEFLAVDPAGLPKKLRSPFEAKRLELWALKRISDGKRRPLVRLADGRSISNCEPPKELDSVGPLLLAGLTEITQDEAQWLMRETSCTECELRTEFSLTLATTPPKRKGGKRLLRYLLHQSDPFQAMIAAKRSGQEHVGSTPFFAIGGNPRCR